MTGLAGGGGGVSSAASSPPPGGLSDLCADKVRTSSEHIYTARKRDTYRRKSGPPDEHRCHHSVAVVQNGSAYSRTIPTTITP
jgi:hypothetical protein